MIYEIHFKSTIHFVIFVSAHARFARKAEAFSKLCNRIYTRAKKKEKKKKYRMWLEFIDGNFRINYVYNVRIQIFFLETGRKIVKKK